MGVYPWGSGTLTSPYANISYYSFFCKFYVRVPVPLLPLLLVNVTKPGNKKKSKKTVSIDQNQMVYYSEKYAKKQRKDREVMVQRAKNLIKHPK